MKSIARPGILSVVSYTVFPAKMGGQKGIALFNEYLAKEADILCFTVRSNDPAYAKGYRLYNRMSNAPLRYINIFNAFVAARLIRKAHITHILLEHPYFGWMGILLKRLTGRKLIIHSHNIESLRWKGLGKWWWRILYWYESGVHRAADFNFFIQDDDRNYALRHWGLKAEKCITITYGINQDAAPDQAGRQRCRNLLLQQHGIAATNKILLFNGALDYPPNLQALRLIIDEINPLLLQSGIGYTIVICGRGLPAEMKELTAWKDLNIVYAGFVDDVTVYFKGADLFINPLVEGGGIKTKLVEAIGYGTPAVSTQNGSTGITVEDAGDMLQIAPDGDWSGFVHAIAHHPATPESRAPAAFYEKFYWGNIVHRAVNFISS